MPRMNFYMDVADDEFQSFMARIGTRAQVADTGTNETTEDETGPVNTNAPAVDKNGVPWLESVHASTKGMTNDGIWRRKKGVTNEQVDAEIAKWRASSAGQPAPAASGAFPAVPAMPGMPGAAAPAGMPGMPGMPTFTPPAAPVPPVEYNDIVAKFQTLATSGKITNEQVMAVYGEAGVTDVNELMTNESLRRKVFDGLSKFG